MAAKPASSQEPISVHGLVGLKPDLVRASNAATFFASATGSVWQALHSSLIPPCFTETTREVAAHTLKLLRESNEQKRADINACREALTRARHLQLARAGELSAENAHLLAVAYYDDLESKLLVASLAAGLSPSETVSPEQLGEHLGTIAKVLSGADKDSVITKSTGRTKMTGASWTEREGVRAYEKCLEQISARQNLGKEIIVMIRQELSEAKATSSASAGPNPLSSCRQRVVTNPFRRAVTLMWKIIEDERERRSSRPRRDISPQEFSALQLEFRQHGAECRVVARYRGWDGDKVEKAIDDLERGIIGLFRRGPDDPHKDDSLGWSIWATNRCTAAGVVVQRFAQDYDAELRLTGPSSDAAPDNGLPAPQQTSPDPNGKSAQLQPPPAPERQDGEDKAEESPFEAIHKEKETLATQQHEREAKRKEDDRRFRPVLLIEALKDRLLDFERGRPPEEVCGALANEFIGLAARLREVGLVNIIKEWTPPDESRLGGQTVMAALRFADTHQPDVTRLKGELYSAFEGLSTIQARVALDHLQLQIRRALSPQAFEHEGRPQQKPAPDPKVSVANPTLTPLEDSKEDKPTRSEDGEGKKPATPLTDNGLTFLPGGFVYRGIEVPLSGNPLEVFKALYKARKKTLTRIDLLKEFWSGSPSGPTAVNDAVSDARNALRVAMRRAKVKKKPKDSIPTVNRGGGDGAESRTAWKLPDLP